MAILDLNGVLIGHRSIAAELGPFVGSMAVALVAAYAARLAARTANERQEEQLAHDSDRQREQLHHDTERQERQLEHDREMRQKEHARDALDAAIELVQETHALLNDFEFDVQEWEARRMDSLPKELVDRWKDLSAATTEMYVMRLKLMVRFGASHAIPSKLHALTECWVELEELLKLSFKRNRSDAERAEFDEKQKRSTESYSEFLVESQNWLNFSDEPDASLEP